MRVVIITTGQPSVNPRVVKEASALAAAGADVTVLFCYWIQWASDADTSILEKVRWKYRLVGGTPFRSKFLYFFTKARFKINDVLNKRFGNRLLFAERAQARCFDELLHKAKSIKADWFIAHNLGALSIALKAAQFHKTAAAFDFEDYHRGENIAVAPYLQKRILYLEQKYVPALAYLSTSSPLITEKVRADFPSFSRPAVTILNCFPTLCRCSRNRQSNDKSLHLFWFSQTIGKNRGLEVVIKALHSLNNPHIHLTLAGRYDHEMLAYIQEAAGDVYKCIHYAGIIQPDLLPDFASRFDIGLATELTTPVNRNICLTNKLFTYLVAGNCILASDTASQSHFIDTYPGVGLLYKNDEANDLATQINRLYADRALLKQCKQNALELAANRMNWETESQKLVKLICI